MLQELPRRIVPQNEQVHVRLTGLLLGRSCADRVGSADAPPCAGCAPRQDRCRMLRTTGLARYPTKAPLIRVSGCDLPEVADARRKKLLCAAVRTHLR